VFAITPSHEEQTSLAALEACACGTPVLVTPQAPIDGLDASGGGRTVAYDVDALAAALAEFADADRAAMGRRAAALVRHRFSWPTVASALETVYSDAARAHARA
jgi:glycosyltransferase involved in cell wall biosynthesis